MRSIFASAVILALGATSAVAQNDPSLSGWVPTLVVRAVPSRPEGVQAQASGDRKLVKGETAYATIWSGRSLCSIGIGSGEPMEQAGPAENVWKMSGDYLGEQNGRHQIRVTSGFTRLAGADSSATTTQTLSLREGDTVVLEALKESAGVGCPVRLVTIEARLALQATDPALARARYAADLWLVHTDRDGKEQREHLVMNLDGSNVQPFMFNRLAFPIPQVDARQGNAEAVIQLTGALRMRPQADGTVDLDLETNRLLFGLERPDGPLRSSPTTVRKTLKLKPDETMAVDFPPPASGYSTVTLVEEGPPARYVARKSEAIKIEADKVVVVTPQKGSKQLRVVTPGTVEIKEGKLILWTNKFFQGHTTRLLITLKPLR